MFAYDGSCVDVMSDVEKRRHGGDIYRNDVKYDFSVNINPLGTPGELGKALHEAVDFCGCYPDIASDSLRQAVSEMLSVPGEYLLFGNGASELFMAVFHAVKPEKTVIPVPSFYGYEHAARSEGGEVIYYDGSVQEEHFRRLLTENVGLLFLANPNNPTGKLIYKKDMTVLLQHCRDRGIVVVLDECFIDFCKGEESVLSKIGQFENLILVRAFTKIFSIPGVRLGFLLCSDAGLRERIKRQLPEWNLSCFAQAAGCVCAKQAEFLRKTAGYVAEERRYLKRKLQENGIEVVSGEANFLLVYTEKPLYEELLKRNILIRNCADFRGLSKGYYRIAVKNREENKILTDTIGAVNWEKRQNI